MEKSARLARGSGFGHEVDQLLDPAEQGRLAVGVRRDARRGSAATRGRGRPGRRAASRARRRPRASTRRRAGRRASAARPSRSGLTAGPDVHERVSDDQHVLADGGAAYVVGDAALLRAGDEVVDQHADASLGPGAEVAQVPRPGRRRRRGAPRRRPRRAGRRPRPSRPARRRAGPRRRSGSPGPPAPGRRWTATDPDAVRRGAAGADRVTGARQRRPVDPRAGSPGRAGTLRRRPRRSSRVRVPRSRSTATISPQKSVMTSSTTSPGVASAGAGPSASRRAPVGGEHV